MFSRSIGKSVKKCFHNNKFFYRPFSAETNSKGLNISGFKTGLFCLSILTCPYWFNGLQEAYWSQKYQELNKREILSDRFQWLHECMLKDELEYLANTLDSDINIK